MIWQGNIKSAWANLRASRFRTYLTMLGIVIGVSSVITVVSLGEGLKHQVTGQVTHLGSNVLTVRPGNLISGNGDKQNVNLLAFLSASTLTDGDVNSLDKLGSLNEVVPVNFVTSSAKSDNLQLDNVSVIGSRAGLADLFDLKTKYGDFLNDQAGGAKVAVIGSDLANKYFTVLNPIGNTLTIAGQTFVVKAVLDETTTGALAASQINFNSAVIIPYDVSKDVAGGKTNLLQILAQTKNNATPDQASKDIHDVMVKDHGGAEDFTVLKQTQLLRLVNGVIGNATNFITAIAAISLIVAGIGIMNIMLASVAERTREIGIRKAIGATDRQILSQFFTEGLVLSVFGGILGIVIAVIASQILKLYTNIHPAVNYYVVLLAVAVSITIGVVFSVIPAIKAARKEPIDALRG
jgi:putative ABC transport system permease protein